MPRYDLVHLVDFNARRYQLLRAVTTVLLVVDTDGAANSDLATYLSTAPLMKFIGLINELSNDPRTHVMPFSVADIKAFSRNPLHLDWRVAA